jgi:hypothetical protein
MSPRWLSIFLLNCFFCVHASAQIISQIEIQDSLLLQKKYVAVINFFQPVRLNVYIRQWLDSLRAEYPGQYLLLVRGLTERGAPAILKERLNFDVSGVPVLINDSLFNSMSPKGESGIARLNEKGAVTAFHSILELSGAGKPTPPGVSGQILFKTIDTIELHDERYPTGIGNIFFRTGADTLLLLNRQFNQILQYDVKTGLPAGRYDFDYDYDSLYIQAFHPGADQLVYARSHRDIYTIHDLPVYECNIYSIAGDARQISFSALIYFIRYCGKDVRGEDSVALLPKMFLALSRTPGDLRHFKYVPIESDEALPAGYNTWLYDGFQIMDDTLLIPVSGSVTESDSAAVLPVLASYVLKDGEFRFRRMEKWNLPKFFVDEKLFYNQSSGKFFTWKDSVYYQFLIYPFAYNLTGKSSFSISDTCYRSAHHGRFNYNSASKTKVYVIQPIHAIREGSDLCYVYQCDDEFRCLILPEGVGAAEDHLLSPFSFQCHQQFSLDNTGIMQLRVGKEKTEVVRYHFNSN